VELNPLRERLRAHLMLALYRSGRQAEALRVYQEYRRALSEALGLDPSPALRQLEGSILNRDPSLEVRAASAPGLPTSGGPTRLRATARRRWLGLALAGSAVVVLAAAVVASSGGGARRLSLIAADSVGAISPVMSLLTPSNVDFVSHRVGNYEYNPVWGALLDQMWVR
jgi:hypothetical protein